MKLPSQLTIGWLYPTLMSTYGDRGNILVLQKRLQWRGIDVTILRIEPGANPSLIQECDLLMMGGAQDVQQEMVAQDLNHRRGDILLDALKKGTPGLFICGAYQFLGHYYLSTDNVKIQGLGFFDMYTKSQPGQDRLIGNIIANPLHEGMNSQQIVGFENHAGRTHFTHDLAQAFARVVSGHGNNDIDQTEGMIKQSAIGTYMHGPLLPKNPHIADWLILQALRSRHGYGGTLPAIPPLLEDQAKQSLLTLNSQLSTIM